MKVVKLRVDRAGATKLIYSHMTLEPCEIVGRDKYYLEKTAVRRAITFSTESLVETQS